MTSKIELDVNKFHKYIDDHIRAIEEKITSEILILELSTLYQNKVYNQDNIAKIQRHLSEMSTKIDSILDDYHAQTTNSVNKIINDASYAIALKNHNT